MAEPTPEVVEQVASTLPPAPAPAPVAEPAPQPTPAPQPAPTTPEPTEPADPLAALFNEETPPPTSQPTEPSQTPQPQTPVEPIAQPAVQETPETYQSYEDYMDEILAGVPKPVETPDPNKVNGDDPEELKKFFDDLTSTVEGRVRASITRQNAIQAAEKKVWEDAFVAYPTLRSNQKVRDMVHNIRMGYFQRNVAITPTQAAKMLVDSLSDQYRKGIADNQVVTTIESVQPVGGTSTPLSTSLDKEDVMTAVQNGGEDALAQILDAEVKAGRL